MSPGRAGPAGGAGREPDWVVLESSSEPGLPVEPDALVLVAGGGCKVDDTLDNL